MQKNKRSRQRGDARFMRHLGTVRVKCIKKGQIIGIFGIIEEIFFHNTLLIINNINSI